MAETVATPKTYISNFSIRLGPFAVTGKLVNVKAPEDKDAKFKYMTPAGKPVKQFYMAEGDDHPYTPGELGRGKEVNGKLVPVSTTEIEEAKDSGIVNNVMSVSVHPAKQVESSLWHSDSAYIFLPHAVDEYFGTLQALISNSPDYAFMSICKIKNFEGLYRLTLWNGNLVLEKMVYPEELNVLSGIDVEVDDKLLSLGTTLMEGLVSDFDPTEYRNTTRERLAAIAPAEGVIAVPVKGTKDKVAGNLLAELEAAVAAQKKPAKKKSA